LRISLQRPARVLGRLETRACNARVDNVHVRLIAHVIGAEHLPPVLLIVADVSVPHFRIARIISSCLFPYGLFLRLVIFPDILSGRKPLAVIHLRVPVDVAPDHGEKPSGGHVRCAAVQGNRLRISDDLPGIRVRIGGHKGFGALNPLPVGKTNFPDFRFAARDRLSFCGLRSLGALPMIVLNSRAVEKTRINICKAIRINSNVLEYGK
jgi:hypothetical protein